MWICSYLCQNGRCFNQQKEERSKVSSKGRKASLETQPSFSTIDAWSAMLPKWWFTARNIFGKLKSMAISIEIDSGHCIS